jgi:hypothetical protein
LQKTKRKRSTANASARKAQGSRLLFMDALIDRVEPNAVNLFEGTWKGVFK